MDIDTRINKVEWVLERHDESIKELRSVSKDLRNSLRIIQQCLTQIKYFALGATLILLADKLGVGAIFRLIGI